MDGREGVWGRVDFYGERGLGLRWFISYLVLIEKKVGQLI